MFLSPRPRSAASRRKIRLQSYGSVNGYFGGPEGARTPEPLVANQKTYFTKSCQNRRQTRGISKLGKTDPRRSWLHLHTFRYDLPPFFRTGITFLSRSKWTCVFAISSDVGWGQLPQLTPLACSALAGSKMLRHAETAG